MLSRSRYRHERLGGAAPRVGRHLRPDRGRVLTAEQLENAAEVPAAISDEDENYVAARTLPGVHPKGAFFTRGSGPQQVRRLHRNAGRISGSDRPPRAQAQSVAPNSCRRPMIETARRCRVRRHHGRRLRSGRARSARPAGRAGHRRPTSCASAVSRSTRAVEDVPRQHDFCFVVEQNRDAQLRSLLVLETGCQGEAPVHPGLRRISAQRAARRRRDSRPIGQVEKISTVPSDSESRHQASATRACSATNSG